jgi:hypothetical protein
MIRHLLSGIVLLAATSAYAAPEWVRLASADDMVTYVDRGSVERSGDATAVRVLRSYSERVVLGNDPISRAEVYPHRSVKIRYMVQCNSGRIALDSWEMYSGNLGDGQVVWADQMPGERVYSRASTEEERFALAVSCAARAAARQQIATPVAVTYPTGAVLPQ